MDFIAGSIAGAFSTFALYPLDLIKTRFQVQGEYIKSSNNIFNYKGIIHAFRFIIKNEGIVGLYQGLVPSLLGSTLSWGIYFYLYDYFKKLQQKDININLPPYKHLFAAVEAGTITTLLTNPIWVIKARIQLQIKNQEGNYTGILNAFIRIWKEEGIGGFYKGCIPALFGVSHAAIQFMAYEEMKKYIYYFKLKNKEINSLEYGIIGVNSKIFATLITYPYQVIKTRLQEKPLPNIPSYSGVMDVIGKTWKYEGIAGFYKGCIPGLLKVAPASGITFIVYENTLKILKKYSKS